MHKDSDIARAFRFARARGRCGVGVAPAQAALEFARENVAEYAKRGAYQKPWYGESGPLHGAPDKHGVRWVEFASQTFRRVGFSDEVIRGSDLWPYGRIDHTGWYTSDDGDTGETFAGVVYRLPHGRGFLAGYEHCETRKGRERENMTEGARLDCSRIYATKEEAAQAGDSIAERESESERDYQAAASAGFMCAEIAGEITRERSKALAFCAEFRELRKRPESGGLRLSKGHTMFPAVCAELRAAVFAGRARVVRLRDDLARLASESRYRNPEAFDESAGSA